MPLPFSSVMHFYDLPIRVAARRAKKRCRNLVYQRFSGTCQRTGRMSDRMGKHVDRQVSTAGTSLVTNRREPRENRRTSRAKSVY